MSNTTSSPVIYNLYVQVNQSTIYLAPIIMALIVVTNTLNISVLCRRSLRTSPCTHYFLALAIVSLVYMCFAEGNMFLYSRFGLSLNNFPVSCRILSFFVYGPLLFFTTMLVCASFDRFCASSSSARVRSFSSVRVAQRVIIIISISLTIYVSPFLLIYHWDYNKNVCAQYSTTLINVYLFTRVVLYYIINPLAMMTFGLLTIRNIRNQTRRVAPMIPQNGQRRTEGQLTRVLIIQVGIHLFFSIPAAAMYVVTTFFPSTNTPFYAGLRLISTLWQQPVFFLSFFSYILSSTVFRTELLKMLKLNNRNNQIVQSFTLVRTRLLTQNMRDTRV